MEIVQVDLNKDYSGAIRHAVSVLKAGGVVVYPTDTLYGLGANALDNKAVVKVFAIKNRSTSKPLPIIVKNMIWAKELAYVNSRNEAILNKVWPGKVTAVLPKNKIVPDILTSGHPSIGMRIPDHILVDQLLGRFGYPLTSTSANVSGDEPTLDINKIIETFSGREPKPDLIIDVGILPPSDSSTILDLTGQQPKILRIGATKPDYLLKLLNGL